MAKPKGASASLRRAAASFDERWKASFGEGTLVTASDMSPYDVVSTGSLVLDYQLGVGGWVNGKIVEIWGNENVGKTTLSLISIAQAQIANPEKMAIFIDVENKFDPKWAASLGVDLTRLRLARPRTAEEVADQVKMLIDSGMYSMIVLDSVGGLISKAAKEKDADEAVVADVAKIVTRMVNIATGALIVNPAIFIIINQVRANISSYGGGTTTSGGFALKHVSFMKCRISTTGTDPFKAKNADGEAIEVGRELAITIERNKAAAPRRIAIVTLMNQATEEYGPVGIDQAAEAFRLGLKRSVGLIKQAGAWFTLPSGEQFQGQPKAIAALRVDPDMVAEIRAAAIASLSNEMATVTPEDDTDEAETEVEFVAEVDTVSAEEIAAAQEELAVVETEVPVEVIDESVHLGSSMLDRHW